MTRLWFTAEERAAFHEEVDAIKQLHNGQSEITWSDVPIRFYPTRSESGAASRAELDAKNRTTRRQSDSADLRARAA